MAAIAAKRGAETLDFMIPSAITTDRDNFWDPVHYRAAIAAIVIEGLVKGESPDAARLTPRPATGAAAQAAAHEAE